jgi:hypothetical protein
MLSEDAGQEVKRPKPWPAIYTWIWPALVAAGRRQGYALALHGSMARDLDVVAVPWTEEAGSEEDLIAEIAEAVQVYLPDGSDPLQDPRFAPSDKPHGRRAWSLHMGGGAYIDLSIMPRKEADHAR